LFWVASLTNAQRLWITHERQVTYFLQQVYPSLQSDDNIRRTCFEMCMGVELTYNLQPVTNLYRVHNYPIYPLCFDAVTIHNKGKQTPGIPHRKSYPFLVATKFIRQLQAIKNAPLFRPIPPVTTVLSRIDYIHIFILDPSGSTSVLDSSP